MRLQRSLFFHAHRVQYSKTKITFARCKRGVGLDFIKHHLSFTFSK